MHKVKKILLLCLGNIFTTHTLSILPRKQMCFRSLMGPGQGTRHQLCGRGNSATTARSPRPTKHMCRRHWRSVSDAHVHVHGQKTQSINIFCHVLVKKLRQTSSHHGSFSLFEDNIMILWCNLRQWYSSKVHSLPSVKHSDNTLK